MAFRTIWEDESGRVCVIDQRMLPHKVVHDTISSYSDAVNAIKEMIVRGAPLIGVTAAYGICLACAEAQQEQDPKGFLAKAFAELRASRPTAVNLFWSLNKMEEALANVLPNNWPEAALQKARQLTEDDVELCRNIGLHGLPLLEKIFNEKKSTVNILTHCNAGMLGCVEWGTISSPIYQAAAKGIPLHVWVDETRPRNQGANLTAWELTKHNIPHTVIVDNTGGHLMQHAQVDIVLVGADRVTKQGDTANKIGTYLKALAAKDNNIPFYVALPSTTIDWQMKDGLTEIPIEERNPDEVKYVYGQNDAGEMSRVLITPITSNAANYGFDVTPARLITGLITEKGICKATEEGLDKLFNRN